MDRPAGTHGFAQPNNLTDENKIKPPTHFCLFLILTILCACAMIFIGTRPHVLIIPGRIYESQKNWFFSNVEQNFYRPATTTCLIPQLNPFDSSILKFYKLKKYNYERVQSRKYPLLFTTDLNTTLKQVDDPEKYGYFSCCYSSFKRMDGSGERVKVSERCEPILKNATIIRETIQFIQISCATSERENASWPQSRRIVDILPFIRVKHIKTSNSVQLDEAIAQSTFSAHENQGNEKQITEGRKKLNVVIFGIDGMSHMNFMRVMPMTYSYLTNNLSAIGLWGYTKVGDNTFPNVVPLLTGLFTQELHTRAHCWDGKRKSPFDSCPVIWKKYSEAGYVTSYGEDAMNMAMFHYNRGGFRKQPTDSYLNSMTYRQMKQIGNNCVKRMSLKYCYGPRLSFEILLNYLKEMALKMSQQAVHPYFQFIWSTGLTHDRLNMGKLGDRYLLETLHWLQNGSYLENTLLILMSDHGIQTGDIRQTLQGSVENRMPLVYFLLPPWFRAKYPRAVHNLVQNQHKLTSTFDIHQTLLDLLKMESLSDDSIQFRTRNVNYISPPNFSNLTKTVLNGQRGLSLFLPIPATRTCKEADIDPMWCLCGSFKVMRNVNKNNTFLREGAKEAVKSINHKLKHIPKCRKLFLKKTQYARVSQNLRQDTPDHAVLELSSIKSATDPRLSRTNLTLFISFRVAPSNAIFEATLTRYSTGEWFAAEEFSRTNNYGSQGWCTSEVSLRKYCYC